MTNFQRVSVPPFCSPMSPSQGLKGDAGFMAGSAPATNNLLLLH